MPFNTITDQLITDQTQRFPDKAAIKFRGDSISYKSLNTKVNQLANLLLACKINVGDIIALATDRSIEMIVAMLAINRVGAVYLPLDPNFPNERLTFMLSDSQAKLLITSGKNQQQFASSTSKLLVENIFSQLENYTDNAPAIPVKDTDVAYLIYTSGSTGKPKGVQVEHHNLVNLLLSIQKKPGLSANDTWLALATISFDISVLEIYLPLITGAKLILADNDMAKDGRLILETVRAEKVTVVQATPYTWRMMLAAGWEEKLPLKVITGGEALPKDVADKLLVRCEQLHNYYGPTETTIYSSGKQILPGEEMITIGKPIDNTWIYILNEKLKPVEDGETGEICIIGSGVARGYLNQARLTAEKFIDNTLEPRFGHKIYRTGDMGRILPNGEIQYMGRLDLQIKLKGYRIEVEEIEYNLIQQPDIENAVIVVHKDRLGNERLVAYVILSSTTTQEDTRKWIRALKSKLPEYMIPTDYIILPKMPLTPNGKIDRKQLPKPVLNTSRVAYAPPETETEKMIADIWARYLGITKPGIHDSFFELGGQSLIAVQIMTKISKITGKLLPIATLFKYPTIQSLALLIQSGDETTTWKSLVPIKPTGNKMPIYIVHGIGLNVLVFNNIATNVDIEQPIYGLQSRGLNGVDDVYNNVHDIAALYIDEILAQNPTGPYAIAGYSIGGYIAIEMAKQLQHIGKEVRILAMFDANFKYFNEQSSLPKRILEIGQRQLRKGVFVVTSFAKAPLATVSFLSYMMKTRVLQRLGLFKEQQPEDVPGYMQKIADNLQYAVSTYKMTPYDGVIHLFKSQIRDYYVDDPKHLGWGKFALQGIKVHNVPGDHLNMLLPPNDKEFARILQNCLNENN